jgi:hypothetical protein
MSNKLQKYLTNNNKNKVFTNKTFNDFRNDLLKYANEFYADNILDFSETSLGGMFLDFASIVGDSLVYYAEQQFNEMDYETAVDPENISRFLKNANIKSIKSSPASVDVSFNISVPSQDFKAISDSSFLPVIHKKTELRATNGTYFLLTEDVDFRKGYTVKDIIDNQDGTYIFNIYKKGLCTSGRLNTEFVTFSNDAGKFLKFELENDEITQVISVYDNDNNEYYEVEYLSQDFVFKKIENSSEEDCLSMVPAPYRFLLEEDYDTGKTTLRFGNGNNNSFSNNILPNTLDTLLPIKNRDYISRIEISPESILNTNLLGISPVGKTLTVEYKYGGGKSHNVSENSINTINNSIVSFPELEDPSIEIAGGILNSLAVNNENRATGGANQPSLDDLKVHLKNSRKMQSRVVTYEDLLTRLFTMPSNFGKIYRAAAINNENFTGIKDIFIVCKNKDDYLESSSDALKTNISKFINENRLIGDNFNIIDSPIFNFAVNLKIKIKKGYDPVVIKFQLINDMLTFARLDSFEIGQGINVNDITKIIESNPGVATIITPKNKIIISKSSEDNRFDFETNQLFSYTNNRFNPVTSYKEGIIFPVRGGIFELKNPINDIEILITN